MCILIKTALHIFSLQIIIGPVNKAVKDVICDTHAQYFYKLACANLCQSAVLPQLDLPPPYLWCFGFIFFMPLLHIMWEMATQCIMEAERGL